MQMIKEGDSVVLDTDSFDTNGRVAKVISVNTLLNRCLVELNDGSLHHITLNNVNPRKFLSE